jgi:UDP-N-acetylglucosamine 4-epimerase
MKTYPRVLAELRAQPRSWLVTGAAGFIGSNLVQSLLDLGQRVVALDDLSTGHLRNLDEAVGESADRRQRVRWIEGSILDPAACREAVRGVDHVLHQAALCSVPASMADPVRAQEVNETGFVRVLEAARAAGVRRVVYASSSAVYGDRSGGVLVEEMTGRPLSPYGLNKRLNEEYACLYRRVFGMEIAGLRYFNVFGPRQDPEGAYAAVVPRWVRRLLDGDPCEVNGDGQTTRDFCHVDNVVQANLLASVRPLPNGGDAVFNVAGGRKTTLLELYHLLRDAAAEHAPEAAGAEPIHRPFRQGDIRHSHAALSRIRMQLGYHPEVTLAEGITTTVRWYALSGADGPAEPARTSLAA